MEIIPWVLPTYSTPISQLQSVFGKFRRWDQGAFTHWLGLLFFCLTHGCLSLAHGHISVDDFREVSSGHGAALLDWWLPEQPRPWPQNGCISFPQRNCRWWFLTILIGNFWKQRTLQERKITSYTIETSALRPGQHPWRSHWMILPVFFLAWCHLWKTLSKSVQQVCPLEHLPLDPRRCQIQETASFSRMENQAGSYLQFQDPPPPGKMDRDWSTAFRRNHNVYR